MNRTRNRRILVQRPMRSDGVVVIGIGFQNPTQMCLAQNNNVVQALAAGRSDAIVRTTSLSLARGTCAEFCDRMLATTTGSELTGHWTKMRRSLARFSGPVSLIHATSLADSITTTLEFRFSVHTGTPD